MHAFHITWVTHNSRVSPRMIEYKVKIDRNNQVRLSLEDEVLITKFILQIVKDDRLKVLAYNICEDHVHIVLVCEQNKLSNTIRKLKGKSTQLYKYYKKIPKEEECHLWAQKFNISYLESERKLMNVVEYVKNNRIKHQLPENKGLQPLVQRMVITDSSLYESDRKKSQFKEIFYR
jgi:REP element-mobilizing transposase RayT